MKLLDIVLVISACLGLATAPARALDVGEVAPAVELIGTTATYTLADLRGKVVYIDFWASWCGPCRQSFPWMNEMQRKYGGRGLQIVGINLDAKRSDADRFLTQLPAQFALAFDANGESALKFGVKGMPTSVLIGRDGRVLLRHQGFRGEDRKALEDQLVTALAAEAK